MPIEAATVKPTIGGLAAGAATLTSAGVNEVASSSEEKITSMNATSSSVSVGRWVRRSSSQLRSFSQALMIFMDPEAEVPADFLVGRAARDLPQKGALWQYAVEKEQEYKAEELARLTSATLGSIVEVQEMSTFPGPGPRPFEEGDGAGGVRSKWFWPMVRFWCSQGFIVHSRVQGTTVKKSPASMQ